MIIYGKNSVYEGLIEKVKFDSIYIEKGKREKFRNLINVANENNIPVLFREKKEIEKISRSRKHQGICASLILPDNIVEDENNFELTENIKNILILDGITDTGNLGAIVRSAVLLNCHLLILPRDNSARLTPQTFKASAGAIYKQRIVYVNNINTWISILRENGYKIISLCKEGKTDICEIGKIEKAVCIIGSEHSGIRKSIKKNSDYLVFIPSTSKIDSFNASVAAAIAMWEIFQKKT